MCNAHKNTSLEAAVRQTPVRTSGQKGYGGPGYSQGYSQGATGYNSGKALASYEAKSGNYKSKNYGGM